MLAASFASLATLTRYIGVSLVASSVLAILLLSERSLKNRIIAGTIFSFISTTPLALWLLRNHSLTGTFMGDRAPSMYSLHQNLYFTRNAVVGWFLPERLEPYYSLLSIAPLLVIALAVAFILKNRLYLGTNIPLFFSLCAYFVSYSAFLIVSSTTTAYDKIGDRLLAPMYPVLLLIALLVVQMLLRGISRPDFRRLGSYAVVGCLAVLVLLPMYRVIRHIEIGLENGYGYTAHDWRSSQTLSELSQTRTCTDRTIYTNRSDVLYILAGIEAYSSPRKTFYNSENLADRLEDIKWPETSPACLVWFEDTRTYLFTPEELSSIANVSLLTEADDGAIYLVSSPTYD